MNENWTLFMRNLRDFWRAFRRNKLGLLGGFLVLTAIIVAVCAPLLTPYAPTDVIRDANGRGMTFAPPSVHGPLGTDDASAYAASPAMPSTSGPRRWRTRHDGNFSRRPDTPQFACSWFLRDPRRRD